MPLLITMKLLVAIVASSNILTFQVSAQDTFALHKRNVKHHARGYYDSDSTQSSPPNSMQTEPKSRESMMMSSPNTMYNMDTAAPVSTPRYSSSTWSPALQSMDSCMAQCQAQCGGGMQMTMTSGTAATYSATGPAVSSMPGPPPSGSANDSVPLMPGPGEVIVAPKQGDLRMVPFNINAEPGSTITFIFGGGPHTVTKSSLENVCQANPDKGFDTGKQMAGFRYELRVDKNETMAYYCQVGMHCSSGMFGLINAAVSLESVDNMGGWMKDQVNSDPAFSDEWNKTKMACQGSDSAWAWGEQLAVNQIPESYRPTAAYSILATRMMLAQSPGNTTSNDPGTASPNAVATNGAAPTSSNAASTNAANGLDWSMMKAFAVILIGAFALAL